MARVRKRKPDDPEQSARFVEAAKELSSDTPQTAVAFERLLGVATKAPAPAKPPAPKRPKG
jgi:hypothetical protein